MNKVYLILGGNMGNRVAFLKKAIMLIESNVGTIKQSSLFYETEAWGMKNTLPFLNCVIEIYTSKDAETLLNILLDIETFMGRSRCKTSYESREIDIDILFFNHEIIETAKLVVPHARLHKRKFALIPMQQLNPNFVHPVYKKTIAVLLNECNDNCLVNMFTE